MTITSCLNSLKAQGIDITQSIFNLVYGAVAFLEKGMGSENVEEVSGLQYSQGPDGHVDPDAYTHGFYLPMEDQGSSQLIWATMVSWWKTGDFTGSCGQYGMVSRGSEKVPAPPLLSPYMKKQVVRLFKEDLDFQSSEVVYEYKFALVLWIIGHWLSIPKCIDMMLSTTRDINLRMRYNDLGPYVAQKSALIRLNGFPAGATIYSIYKQTLDEMSSSVAGYCVQCTPELSKNLQTFVETYNLISSNRKSYHRNADLLGVKVPLQVPYVPEELALLLSSFLHVYQPHSSFTKSKTVLSRDHLVRHKQTHYLDFFAEIEVVVSAFFTQSTPNHRQNVLRNLAMADNPLPVVYRRLMPSRKDKSLARTPSTVIQLKKTPSFEEMKKKIVQERRLKTTPTF